MIAKSVDAVMATSKNGLGRSWEAVWILWHDGISACPITLGKKNNGIIKDAKGFSWNHRKALLDNASFSNWDDDSTPNKNRGT